MGVATIICEYIYGSFLIIKTAVEAGTTVAKKALELIDILIVTIVNTLLYSMNPMINMITNLIKVYQKKLADMLGLGGGDDSIWCSHLFDCLALLNELIDPNSFLFRLLKKLWKKECKSGPIDDDLINKIREWISDFDSFRKTVCKYGFTFEFGIELIRGILMGFKSTIEGYIKWLMKQKDSLKKRIESWLNLCVSSGLIEYLEKLTSFFLCVIDSSESCASIATASSFYNDTMAKLSLEKKADGCYDMSQEKKNSIYGSLEGAKVKCSNLKYDIEDMCNAVVNPTELERANKAFNLSKNVFPANMSLSDFTKEDGSFSWGKLTNPDTWSKYSVYQKCKNMRRDWNRLIERRASKDKLTYKELLSGAFMGSDGNIYYKDGCNYIRLPDQDDDEIIRRDVYMINGAQPCNDIMLDPDTNQMISVTVAAIRIYDNPKSKLANKCHELWSYINGWQINGDIAVHGAGIEKPI